MGNNSDHPSFARLFERARGNSHAENAFYKIAFRRLRAIASALLQKERAGHTLTPTALVSELFLKLRGGEGRILGEEHFFRLAAGAMQQVLIDQARSKAARKRIPAELVSELLPGLDRAHTNPELRPWANAFDTLGRLLQDTGGAGRDQAEMIRHWKGSSPPYALA